MEEKEFFDEMSFTNIMKYYESVLFAREQIDKMEKEIFQYLYESKKYKEKYNSLTDFIKDELKISRQHFYNKIK